MPPNANVTMRQCRKRPSPNKEEFICCDDDTSQPKRITRSVAKKRRAALDTELKSMMGNNQDVYSAGYAQIIGIYNIAKSIRSDEATPKEILQEVIKMKFPGFDITNIDSNTLGGDYFKKFLYYLSGFIFYDTIGEYTNSGTKKFTKELYDEFKRLQESITNAAFREASARKDTSSSTDYFYLEEDDLCQIPEILVKDIEKDGSDLRISSNIVSTYLNTENDVLVKSDLCALLYVPSNKININIGDLSLRGGKKNSKPASSKANKPKPTKQNKPKATQSKATKPKATKPKATKPKATKPKK